MEIVKACVVKRTSSDPSSPDPRHSRVTTRGTRETCATQTKIFPRYHGANLHQTRTRMVIVLKIVLVRLLPGTEPRTSYPYNSLATGSRNRETYGN